MFEMHLDEDCISSIFAESNQKVLKNWIHGVFIFSLVWSIGASVDTDGRAKFSEFVLDAQTGKSELYPPPEGVSKIENQIPEYVYDYYFELKGPGKWHHWSKLLLFREQLEIKECS